MARQMLDSERKRLFGLDARAKWPVGGMPMRSLEDGWIVWVRPLVGEAQAYTFGTKTVHHRRSNHRCMASCPKCDKIISAGRMAQHRCKV